MPGNDQLRLLMIDNYDSFTYNLVQYLGELGADVTVKRNDAIDVAGVRALHPAAVVISPGPCTPSQAGISLKLLREMAGEVPILGVCLGLQCIGEAFGGKVVRAPEAILVGGSWTQAASGATMEVINPATEETIAVPWTTR